MEGATTKPIVVTLTLSEALGAYYVAGQRITASKAMGLNHATTYERGIRTRVDEEVVGVMGERALAKWLNVYSLDPINTFHHAPDCGDCYEVRSTAVRDGKLIVRDNDKDEPVFVLALVALDCRVVLRGWIHGWAAKRDEWYLNPHGRRPCWMVPQESLHPMDTLPGTRGR